MANRLTPFGMVLKWLIAPVAIGAIGYYLVGPRVESKVAPELIDKVKTASGMLTEKEPEVKRESSPRTFSEPEVDVTVTALNRREDKPKRRRRKRSTTPKRTEVAPAVAEPSVAPPPPTTDGDGAGNGAGNGTGDGT